MDLFQKFSASFPISIQTALSYLGSQLAGFHSFYYTWFTIERIVFYFPKFVETNLNKNPNVTCALLFPEAFAPVILLTVFFVNALHSFASLYTSKFLDINQERLHSIILTVIVIVGLFEIVSTLILDGGFCRPKKILRLVKYYALDIELEKFPPSQSPPYIVVTIYMCFLLILIKTVMIKRQNRMIRPSSRNHIIPAIPTISEHNKQVLQSGSVFDQNKTQTKSIDLAGTSYPQLLKVKSSEMNPNFSMKNKRPASGPLNKSNVKTLILPKTLRRKSESDIFILSQSRQTKIHPIANIQNCEGIIKKITNEGNSFLQTEYNKNRIQASLNNLKTNRNYNKRDPVNFLRGANSNVDFITTVESSNALLLGSDILQSQSQTIDFQNEVSRSEGHVSRGQEQVMERRKTDVLELKKQLSNKHTLLGVCYLVCIFLFKIGKGQNIIIEFSIDLMMGFIPMIIMLNNENFVKFIERKIINNHN